MPNDHLGGPLPEGRDFHVPAPAEIGKVLSQFSTKPLGEAGTVSKSLVKLSLLFLFIAACFGISYLVTKNIVSLAGALLFGGFAGLRALNTKRFECNYVGDQGFARYRVGTKDAEQSGLEGGVFTFDSAAHLFTNVIETKGLVPFYGQNAIYQWVPARQLKAKVNIMTDQYVPSEKPTAEDLICFLRASESSWTNYHLSAALQILRDGGKVEFPYRIGGKLELSSEHLTITTKNSEQIPVNSISAIKHEAGDVIIIGNSGDMIWKGNCFHLANIMLLENLLIELFGFKRGDSGIQT